MPIQTFSADSSSLVFSGRFYDLDANGHHAKRFYGENSRSDFVAHGTDLSLQCCLYDPSGFSVQVDGGAWTALSCQNAWGFTPLYTGLPDEAHMVTLLHTSGSRDIYIDRDIMLTLTGSMPQITLPVGFGPQTILSEVEAQLYIRQEGGWIDMDAGGYASPPIRAIYYPDARIRFRARCQSISIWCYQNGGKFKTQIDNADQSGVLETPVLHQFGWFRIFDGLNALEEHEYSFSNASLMEGACFVYMVMTVGGSGISVSPLPDSGSIVFFGDSLTQALTGDGNDSSLGFAHLLGLCKGMAVWNRGVAASTVRRFPSGSPAVTELAGESPVRVQDIGNLLPPPAQVVVLYGTNDLGQVGGLESVEEFYQSYMNMMQQLRSLLPHTSFLCLSLLPRTDISAVLRAPWNDAIRQAAGSFQHANVEYICTDGWISDLPGNEDLADGVHLSTVGHQKIARELENRLLYGHALQDIVVIAGEG